MNTFRTDPLLEPFRLKHLALRNRIMSTSHACGLGDADHMPGEAYQAYHVAKARGGLALTMFGDIKRTALLQNFPNPFNPETWIPYTLADDADVSVRIYDVAGKLVRNLEVGHQQAGRYISRDTAAYWDGRDQLGESVSSGVYFYTLKADGFSDTRRMVILK